MIENIFYFFFIVIFISNIYFINKYLKRKRRKRSRYTNEKYNLNSATSKANYHNIKTAEDLEKILNDNGSDKEMKDLAKIELDDLNKKKLSVENKLKTQLEKVENRLDKIEVYISYIKNFTIKTEIEEPATIIPDPSDVVKKPLFFSNSIKPISHKKSKLFSEKEIDTELRNHLGEILFLTPSEYKDEYQKAYRRLYYKTKLKNK